MGLAVSQVRLLALTSRKADVEMQIQLNSKRKTMLTREATDLAKLYYAKLQNTKIQYSTTNGYKDVTYGYLMAQDNNNFFDSIVNANGKVDRKVSDSMILTDTYGRVILSDSMLQIVVDVLNKQSTPTGTNKQNMTVEDLTLAAMERLLILYAGGSENSPDVGTSETASNLSEIYQKLYTGSLWSSDGGITGNNPATGEAVLQHLIRNGYQSGGALYYDSGKYYSDYRMTAESEVTPTKGTFYVIRDSNSVVLTPNAKGGMYWPGCTNNIVPELSPKQAEQLCNMFSYYGSIFAAAFNGNKTCADVPIAGGGTGDLPVKHFNVAANIGQRTKADGSTEYYRIDGGNSTYTTISNVDNLQAGLKSGLYQLVNVTSPVTGGYAKAQGLDYFETQNYVVEKADSAARDTVTAWYDAARADLESKESYWDSEITALSSELNSITTEIDSVKKLREDAISATFKWGSA